MSLDSDLKAKIRREVIARTERHHHMVYPEHSKEFLRKRGEFVAQWQEMCDEGERLGYLEWTNDYPGSHLAPTVGEINRAAAPVKVFTETAEQYNQRINEEVNRIFKARRKEILERG